MTTEAIKSIDGLVNIPAIKLTPEVLSKLAENLRLKYGVDINGNIFNITREELDGLKSDMEKTKDPQYTLEKFLYEEFVETKLEKEGLKAVSLDIVTSGIESSRVDDAKKKFELIISDVLNKYDFLDDNTKNLLKLSIANRLLSNPMASEIQNTLSDAGIFIEGFETKKVGDVSKKVKEISKKSEKYEDAFAPILSEYDDIFKKVGERFSALGGNLSKEQKQAIISNVEWFKNPYLIEAGVSKFDLTKVDISKTTKDENIDVESVKKYLLNSRDKIQGLASQLESGDKLADTIYGFLDGDNFISKGVRSFVEMLLEIPFLGKIFAMFLGLDPENALAELNENATNFKMFKALKGLGSTKDEKGKKIEGKGIFKNVDLGTLSFNNLKGEIKEIKKSFPNLKEEEYENFFIKAFSEEGFDVNGYKFKFELSQEQKSKSKLETKDIKSSIKDGLENYGDFKKEEDKKAKEQERIEKESKILKAQQETKSALGRLDLSISAIDRILSGGYNDIPNWNSWFNFNDVNVANISDILKQEGDNFDEVIKKAVGESNFKDITDKKFLPFLNDFFALIREYFKDKKKEEIFSGTLEKFMDSESFKKGFIEFLQSKKTGLKSKREETSKKDEELTKEQSVIAFENKISEKIKSLSDGVKLSDGFELYDGKVIKFDKLTQKLQIGDKYFSIVLKHNGKIIKLEDISILNGRVNFELEDLFLSSYLSAKRKIKGNERKGLIDKETIENGIIELIKKGKFNYESREDNIDLKIGL